MDSYDAWHHHDDQISSLLNFFLIFSKVDAILVLHVLILHFFKTWKCDSSMFFFWWPLLIPPSLKHVSLVVYYLNLHACYVCFVIFNKQWIFVLLKLFYVNFQMHVMLFDVYWLTLWLLLQNHSVNICHVLVVNNYDIYAAAYMF